MIKQSLKDIYFILNNWFAKPNSWLVQARFSAHRDLVLHLGCGDDYRDGMINIDGNITRKKDLWLDLRNRLPFKDGSVRTIYCCHTLEHLFPEDALALLCEMKRVISDEGIVRLAVPSFEWCLDIASGRRTSDWPRKFESPAAQAINYLFCDGQHKYGYCAENLADFAKMAGFRRIVNYSAEHGVKAKNYDGLEIGGEPEGSLVFELTC